MGDSKVRKSHSALNGTIRDLSDSPDPGEEINCRCWAEPINCDNAFVTQNVISEINDAEDQWAWWDYLYHFWAAGGQSVDLANIGWLGPIIEEAKNQVFVPVQEQVIALAREIEQGPLFYTTENTYEFEFVSYPIGDATVSSETSGMLSINGKCLIIEAEVVYTFFDDFTDPLDIREINDAIQNNVIPEGAPDWLKIQLQRGGWTDFGGTPYLINGTWETSLSAVVKRKNQTPK